MPFYVEIVYREPSSELLNLGEDRSFELDYDDLNDLVQQNDKLEASLERLKTVKALSRSKKAREAIQEALECAGQLGGLVEDIFELLPANKRPTEESAVKAEETFQTVELLENILLCLEPAYILEAMGVNKTWRDTIAGSVKVQRVLGLLAEEEGSLYHSPFSDREHGKHGRISLPDFPYNDSEPEWRSGDNDYTHYGIHVGLPKDLPTVAFNFSPERTHRFKPFILPNPGERIRGMFICQPPVKTLLVRISDDSPDDETKEEFDYDQEYGWHTEEERSSETGFTVDDLLGMAAEYQREYGDRFDVNFIGRVPLSKKDPVYKLRKRERNEGIRERVREAQDYLEEHPGTPRALLNFALKEAEGIDESPSP